uniref:G_PROTEIN_RECEP_F1_2 domain-containing protein n=1 Tax=Wuchereria bancrofti TaxID=6293 RepID=A0A1I8EEE2_WUCBA
MCCPMLCARYRNYCIAVSTSVIAWIIAFSAAIPLFLYSEVIELQTYRTEELNKSVCIAKWPSLTSARWFVLYITFSSILIYAVPLALMTYFNYNVLKKLRKALNNSKRMKLTSKSRAPYHRYYALSYFMLHVGKSPFWLFNLLSSVFQFRIHTCFNRLIVNVIHLFPYINCALNPLLYAANAENFRRAFRSLFSVNFTNRKMLSTTSRKVSQTIAAESFFTQILDPYVVSLPFLQHFTARKRRFAWCNERNHSIITRPVITSTDKDEKIELNKFCHTTKLQQQHGIVIYRNSLQESCYDHISNQN